MPMEITRSKRTVVSEFEESDITFLLELINSPGWKEFVGDKKIRTEEACLPYLQFLKGMYTTNGFGLYKLSLAENGNAIGMVGLVKRPDLQQPDLGFAILPKYEGQGFVSESARAVMAWAKNNLSISKLYAITVKGNERSINLLERLGFVKELQNEEYFRKKLVVFACDLLGG